MTPATCSIKTDNDQRETLESLSAKQTVPAAITASAEKKMASPPFPYKIA